MKFFLKALAFIGLTTLSRAVEAEKRIRTLEVYAEAITDKAEKAGDMVVSGDGACVTNCDFTNGRRLIVPPYVKNVFISCCRMR